MSISVLSRALLAIPSVTGWRARLGLVGSSSTDNAIPRFDGTEGALQTSGAVVSDDDQITAAKFTTFSATIADDAAVSFDAVGTFKRGLLTVAGLSVSRAALLYVRADATPSSGILVGNNIEVTTGVLTGTTGTDGVVTVSPHTDEKIYIENRVGGNTGISVVFLGD